MMIDFDVILQRLGAFGKYQIMVFVALTYYKLPDGMIAMAPVFLSYAPEYKCAMPFDKSDEFNLTFNEKVELTTPLDEEGVPEDPCVRFGYNVTECIASGDLLCVNTSKPTSKCNEFYYNDELFTETTVTEFDLVCDRQVYDSVSSSMYMVGVIVGFLTFGNICDRYGRRITTIINAMGIMLGMLGSAFSTNIAWYSFWRCFQGVFAAGCEIGIFTHFMEIVGSSWRTFVGVSYQIGFALGYILWSEIAYFYRDWRKMQLASLIISLPLALIVFFVPESPRWLFARGRDEEGKKVTAIIERFNKVRISETVWTEAEECIEEDENKTNKSETKYTTFDLFRHSELRNVVLNLGFNWAVNNMVYYGVSLNTGNLAGNIFLNNIYGGIFEIASFVVCILIMDRVGRRLLLTVTLTGSGVALICSTIVNEYAGDKKELITLGVALAFVGKALVSGSYAVIYNLTGELLPTVLRGIGFGFTGLCTQLGGIFSPFILDTQYYVSWLPNTIFGTFAITGGLLSLKFRDTTGVNVMETIEEAELFYTGKSSQRSGRFNQGMSHRTERVAVDNDKQIEALL